VSKTDILCSKDKDLMVEFSGLCMRRLNNSLPLRLFLSPFQPFFNANVHKEIEKDRLVIEHAASGFESGKDRADIDVDGLFEETKKFDNEFIERLSNPLFSIEVKYDDFAEVRKRRIACLIGMVFDLFHNWRDVSPYAEIVKRTFREEDYREVLGEVLHLYNVETRLLGNSFAFHGPAGRVKDLFAGKLFATMEETAKDIAAAHARKIYPGNIASCSEVFSGSAAD